MTRRYSIGRLAVALSCSFAASGPAGAVTGEEFLRFDEATGTAYVQGAVGYMLADFTSYDEIRNTLTRHRYDCFAKQNPSAETLYKAVVREITVDPTFMGLEVADALKNATFKLCGPPAKPWR